MLCAYTQVYMHVVPVVTKVVTSRYNSIINRRQYEYVVFGRRQYEYKVFGRRQFGYKHLTQQL
jgi:hypothetical protein